MLVDSDFKTAYAIRMPLENEGFRVDTFTNPLVAYEVFKENLLRYSIIIADTQMLENQGMTLVQLILKIKPDTKIILLRKPFTPAQIINEVKKQIEQ